MAKPWNTPLSPNTVDELSYKVARLLREISRGFTQQSAISTAGEQGGSADLKDLKNYYSYL